MDTKVKQHLGRPLLTGPIAVEVTLVDGSTFRLMFGSEDWFEDEGFSILAMREGEEKLRMVFLRYDTIARVEAFEPAEGRIGSPKWRRRRDEGHRLPTEPIPCPATGKSSGLT